MESHPLTVSIGQFRNYPHNLFSHDVPPHRLQAYTEDLQCRESRLFNDKCAAVDIVDYNERTYGAEPEAVCIANLKELKQCLRKAFDHKDPKCRFIFLHAPHSRAALRISRDMLTFLFSYHQVMASFLEFLVSFGKQEHARDFHFSGLKEDSRIHEAQKGIVVQELGRSGREMRLCYNLRSVERSLGQERFPWSIRQSAVYHTFDIETGQILWINVKANKLMKNRVLEPSELPATPTKEPICQSFSDSLRTHILFSDWSGENWRWYINDLEIELDTASSKTLIAPIDQPPTPNADAKTSFALRKFTGQSSRPSRTNSRPSSNIHEAQAPRTQIGSRFPAASLTERRGSTGSIGHEQHNQKRSINIWKSNRAAKLTFGRMFKDMRSNRIGALLAKRQHTLSNTSSLRSSRTASIDGSPPSFEKSESTQAPQGEGSKATDIESDDLNTFTMEDLQRIQYVEEKLQEASLMLKFNGQVLQGLREHYRYAISLQSFPPQIKASCENDIEKFHKRIQDVEKDLVAHQSRIEMLLCLAVQRKQLMGEIVQYRSMRATEMSAQEAQSSADNMEALTDSMHDIASKTKRETVSMRVITSVTLFFLPGTFVATLMSTDIIRFSDEPGFHLKALQIYLAICLPIMALTFLAWFLMARRRDHMRRDNLPRNDGLV